MKTIKTLLYYAIVVSLISFSCSSDSDEVSPGGDENLANQQNQLEETKINTSILDAGVLINGATSNPGTPPAPNSNLDLAVETNTIEGHQSSGFNLKFSTTESDVQGAYLLFKDLDGNAATNYLDIPFSSFSTDKRRREKESSINLLSRGNGLTDGEYIIDVDFGDEIPPGQFCGDLCIYDSQNNISQIVTICIEVEAWGGNASIVGRWLEIDSTDGDDTTQISCNNGQSVNAEWEQVIKEEFILTLEANGDFTLEEDSEYNPVDFTASAESCSAVYSESSNKYSNKETGKWAFNEDNETLTLVSFEYEDFIQPQFNEIYPNGELLTGGVKAEIIAGTLVITETYIENGETFTDVFTFRRI